MKATNVRAFNVLALPLMALAVLALVLAFGFGGAERAVAQTQNENGIVFDISGILDVKLIGPCEINGDVSIQTGVVAWVENENELYFDYQDHTGTGKITVKCPQLDPQTFQLDLDGSCTETEGGPVTNLVVDPPAKCTSTATARGFCASIGEAGEDCNVVLELQCSEVLDFTQVDCVVSSASNVVGKFTGAFLTVNAGGSVTLTSNGVGGIVTDLAPEQPALPLEAADSSGTSAGLLAGIVAGISAAVVAVVGVAWYARRRLIS